MPPSQADRPPTDSAVEYRRWLIGTLGHPADWVDQLLTPREIVAEYPCVASTINSLKTMRSRGRGPTWIALPAGIRYRRHDVLRFIDQHVHEGAA